MKSIISDAFARASPRPAPQPSTSSPGAGDLLGADDEELEEILKGLRVKIKIIGCGGGGSNTIARLAEEGVVGAEMFAANTDAKHLLTIRVPRKILIGRRCTKGLGAGALPEVGEQAAKETEEDLKKAVSNADIVFVTCGLGGGTGTGAVPIVAKLAKESGALTIAVVTLPFKSEGQVRMQNAMFGLQKLESYCDTVIMVPNDKLLQLVPKLPLEKAFRVADEVLMNCIKGITEIVTKPGLVNLDYSDLRTIMKNGGPAMVGIGESDDDNKAVDAVTKAINSPLLDVDITGATGAIVSVTGGPDMTVSEAEKVAEVVAGRLNPNARIIWGCTIDPTMERVVKVLLVVTGVKSKYTARTLLPQRAAVDVLS